MTEPAARISRAWQALFVEPFYWFRLCFVQPSKFAEDIEVSSNPSIFPLKHFRSVFRRRFAVMSRLFICLFLLSSLCTVVLRFIFLFLFHEAFSNYLTRSFLFASFLLDTLGVVFLVVLLSTLVGPILGLAMGVAFSLSGSIWAGIMVNLNLQSVSYQIILNAVLFIAAVIFGIAVISTKEMRFRNRTSIIGGLICGVVGFLLGILLPGLAGGYLGGFLIHVNPLLPSQARYVSGSVLGATLGFVYAILLTRVIEEIVRGVMRKKRYNAALERGISIGRIFCITAGGIAASAVGISVGVNGLKGINVVFIESISPYLSTVVVSSGIGIILGFLRLPLWPYSSVSMLFSYRASRKEPRRVFEILHASALYWNEYVPLRLHGLRQMLQLAANQDEERALQEINFIVMERPTQIAAAHRVMLEITLDRLEECDNLKGIGEATQHLGRILPAGERLIDPRWVKPLAWLNNACQSAANYCFRALREIQARRDALDEMIANLRRVHADRAFEDEELNVRLSDIVERWLEFARQEREKVEQSPIIIGSIDNPYVCGPALKANNTLFVGRRDLMNQLERALNKGEHRPCFFLTGERRMGKTSTLNQLSNLLSPRYLTIILDLQARGISASTTIFLTEIAGAISKAMDQHGLRVHNLLEHDFLEEVSRGNEAQAYYYFSKWLSEIEAILEKNNRTVLLAFDEFEKLEEASKARSLDLQLLLDWFRSVMQNHPRLALLFSGVKSLYEIEAKSKLIWSGYLVNVRTLNVSLLRPADAENLITEPVAHYPGRRIFDKEVVDEIIRVTGCHPFLIQAVCSELIDLLNAENRKQACLPDVAAAATEALQSWWDTYFRDLWERTTEVQRLCLAALRRPGDTTLEEVAQETGLDVRTVTQALNKLKQRDLAFSKGHGYSIVAPMFEKWVELNQE